MSGSRRRPAAAAFSLFSMLDALLCVMGALILILAVISKATHDKVAPSAPDAVAAAEAGVDREMLELRIQQLAQQRDRTQEDLRQKQLELGHLETSARQVRGQIDELLAAAAELEKNAALSNQDRTALEFELGRKDGEIARKRLELDERRRKLNSQAPSFAVVPYVGPNGTRRRPIYIECTAHGIFLQPEGIELTEEDFEGPLGPGNPLAASLRAAREHMVSELHSSDGESGEPYPFLLVRPDGIVAYLLAREALQSWGDNFGYELIENDWQLAYKPVNNERAEHVQAALDVAREQQRMLARMVPRVPGSGRVYRANPGGGGIVADRGGGGRPRMGRGSRSRGHSFAGGGESGSGDGYVHTDRHGDGGYAKNGVGDGPYPSEQTLDGRTADGSAMYGADGPGFGRGGAADDGNGQGDGQYARDGGSGTGRRGDQPDESGPALTRQSASGDQYASAAGDGQGKSGPDGEGGTQGANEQGDGQGASGGGRKGAAAGDTDSDAGNTNRFAQRGEGSEHGGSRGSAGRKSRSSQGSSLGNSPLDTPGQMAGGGSGGSPSGSSMGTPQINYQAPPVSHRSLAEKRGKNWGVPEESRGASPITRPVVLMCRQDAIFVMSDDGRGRRLQAIPFDGDTEQSVDALVAAVWKHIEGWGIAGNAMYWHPVLVLDVQPDGQQRAAELQALLTGSGIEVRPREKPSVTAQAQTPTTRR